jgi:hypothetical protein
MKTPKPQGTMIDLKRTREWANDFAAYRYSVSEDRIRQWIDQFDQADRDLAARLLDCVDFFSHDQIAASFRAVLAGLDGWHQDESKRQGRWRFVAYSASAGESGDSMLHKFRHANNLAGRAYNELFIHRSDILRERLGSDDIVVLIDDFVGTGDQACDAWAQQFGELLADVGRVYLVVVAACDIAASRVANETGLQVVPHHELTQADNIFAGKCRKFTGEEKTRLLAYCQKADHQNPRGKGDCGLLVVFAHTCPNNSIPVLHVSHRHWEGLFRRYN